MNLVIDPGHGGTDPGAYNTEVSGSIYEKTATLDIGLKLRSYCGSLAKSIYMTRTTDETVGETLRESRINNSGGNLLISIHHNSTTNHTANGIETYYYDSADHYIADDVHIKAKEAYFGSTYGYFSDRGVKYGNYYVLRDTTVPGCLVEAGFISNTDHDYQIINSSSYRDEIAYHLYLGIRNYWLGY
ncbi:N-acetylmuramoyl-L-alanine amidase family protein [Thermoanaerobacterium sp. DL9XJH110]|uniref:N-acetylmuramoyl-L-alanine amidase family protein n=1 Tax=Thermoanaerobacterium sp. DL9XJH110 TaxID=3386643 RepID=UPI003BB60EF9